MWWGVAMASVYSNLTKLLISSSVVEKEDIVTIQMIGKILSIQFSDLASINDLICKQVDLEVGIVYLTGKYNKYLKVLEDSLEHSKSSMVLGLPKEILGKRVTREVGQAYVTTDEDFKTQQELCTQLRSLCELLYQLSRLVFNRSNKLEMISTNYRRELTADSNS